MSRTLIAYYSQSGQTAKMAKLLAEKTGADLYEILPVRSYDDDMWEAWDEAQAERRENRYPALKAAFPDISSYDTVLVGGAVWGFTLSNPVISFMRGMDFTGKKVSAFWTFYDHDEKYDNDMRTEAKGGAYVRGLPLPRSITGSGSKTNEAMDHWLRTLS